MAVNSKGMRQTGHSRETQREGTALVIYKQAGDNIEMDLKELGNEDGLDSFGSG
jgi:hypothetical protein